MRSEIINCRLSNEERECHILYDNVSKAWRMDTTILKFANKAKKQGWEQLVEYKYPDGTEVGGVFCCPAHGITIRGAEKKKMSEKQLGNLEGDDDDD